MAVCLSLQNPTEKTPLLPLPPGPIRLGEENSKEPLIGPGGRGGGHCFERAFGQTKFAQRPGPSLSGDDLPVQRWLGPHITPHP